MIFTSLIFNRHLDDKEKILFVAHKHIIAFINPFIKINLFAILLPWIIYAIFPPFFYLALGATMLGLIRLTYDFIDWYCDAWLITSQGIIDMEWKGIFHHTSTRVEYSSIEGVSNIIAGFWSTILRYGTCQIDKIGNANPTILEYANKPKKIELKVLEFKDRYETTRSQQDSEGLKLLLADMVAQHLKNNNMTIEDLQTAPESESQQIPIIEEEGLKHKKIIIQD